MARTLAIISRPKQPENRYFEACASVVWVDPWNCSLQLPEGRVLYNGAVLNLDTTALEKLHVRTTFMRPVLKALCHDRPFTGVDPFVESLWGDKVDDLQLLCKYGEPVPKTFAYGLHDDAQKTDRWLQKPNRGSKGIGIELLPAKTDSSISGHSGEHRTSQTKDTTLHYQQYLPGNEDYRVLFVGFEPFAQIRRQSAQSICTNKDQGGMHEECTKNAQWIRNARAWQGSLRVPSTSIVQEWTCAGTMANSMY